MKKIKITYKFKRKRNYKLVTPCCNSHNKDGKFVNFENLPDVYGYCHSCGQSIFPPNIYVDENGKEHTWNSDLRKFEPFTLSIELIKRPKSYCKSKQSKVKIRFIPEETVWNYYKRSPENNLLKYLRKTYGCSKVDLAKELYALGTTEKGQAIFWSINKNLKVQKAKYMFYDKNGRRNGAVYQPYTNDKGYYSTLFGEHLIIDKYKGKQVHILVESEKTAIVGSILLPKYTWLAYGGATLFTIEKAKPLIGHKVVVIPDFYRKAVEIIEKEKQKLISMGIDFNIWDMTKGKSDEQLDKEGLYKCDIEDILRKIKIPESN